MGLFSKKKKNQGPLPAPADPKWVHGEGGRFPKFLDLDPEAAGLGKASGVFAIWHTGQKPEWVYVGASQDMAKTFFDLGNDERILEYRDRGRLYCSWSYIRKEFQPGAVCYLSIVLNPVIPNPDCPDRDYVDLVPILPPGMTLEQLEKMYGPDPSA